MFNTIDAKISNNNVVAKRKKCYCSIYNKSETLHICFVQREKLESTDNKEKKWSDSRLLSVKL